MSASKRRRKIAVWAVSGLSVMALGGAVAAYGYYTLDWGCPSNADMKRPFATQEVLEAFTQGGLKVEPTRLPVTLPPGARAYRHNTQDASLFVVVCVDLCSGEGPDQLPDFLNIDFVVGSGLPQRMRSGINLLNVFIGVTDSDRRSAQRLIKRVHPIVSNLDRTPPPDDRCYVR
jgi:hypothetical protein